MKENLIKLIEEYARIMYCDGTIDGYNGNPAYTPERSEDAKKELYDFIEKMEIEKL